MTFELSCQRPAWRRKALRASLPAPHWSIVRVDHRAEVAEAALQEDARGRVRLRQGMRPNQPNLSAGERKGDQRGGR